MAEKYLRDALLKVEAVCKGGGEEMVRLKCKLVSTIIFQVSPCMADKWESLLSNLGHTYRKLRRLNSFSLFIYVRPYYLRRFSRYDEALSFHQQALVLKPLNPSTYSAIGFVQVIINNQKQQEATVFL